MMFVRRAHLPHVFAACAAVLHFFALSSGAQDTNWQLRVGHELRASLDALARARAEIADEKIPLAEKLSLLEHQLIDARREYKWSNAGWTEGTWT